MKSLARILPCSGLVALALAWAQEPAPSPAPSPACLQALDRLDTLRREHANPVPIEQARQHASRLCLGGPAPAMPPREAVQPPVGVAPTDVPAPTGPPGSQAPPPPVVIPQAAIISNCDTAGCWDGEGRRLNLLGSELLGPRGSCVRQAAVYVCP